MQEESIIQIVCQILRVVDERFEIEVSFVWELWIIFFKDTLDDLKIFLYLSSMQCYFQRVRSYLIFTVYSLHDWTEISEIPDTRYVHQGTLNLRWVENESKKYRASARVVNACL